MEGLGRWLENCQPQSQPSAQQHSSITGVTANALRAFVLERFGLEATRHVFKQQGKDWAKWGSVPMGSMQQEHEYLSAVLALTSAFNMDLYDFLYEFGQFLLVWMAELAGYGRALHRVAASFPEFCRGLTHLMDQMYDSVGNIKNVMPHIAVRQENSDCLTLLLFGSQLPNRTPVLLGLLDRIARHVFDLHITFERLPDPTPGTQALHVRMTSMKCPPQPLPQPQPLSSWTEGAPSLLGPSPEDFYALFPFHFVMDRQFRLLQAGSGLKKSLPQLVPGVQVNQLLTILHPTVAWDARVLDVMLEEHMNFKVCLETHDGLLGLKGAVYKMRPMRQQAGTGPAGGPAESTGQVARAGEDVLVFMGSPNCRSFDGMVDHNLYLSDIPAHSMMSEYVLMADHRRAKIRDLEITVQTLTEERSCTSALRETLAEALAAQHGPVGEVKVNSAVDLTLKLLDSLIMRQDVEVHNVLYVRDALLRAGANPWRPVNLDACNIDKDQEVNEALGTMLGTTVQEVEHMDPADLNTQLRSDSRAMSAVSGSWSSDDPGHSGSLSFAHLSASSNTVHQSNSGQLTVVGHQTNQSHSGQLTSVQTLVPSKSRSSPQVMDVLVVIQASTSSPAGEHYGRHTHAKLAQEPTSELSIALRDVDAWQYDVFALDRASGGRPLSCLAFHLMKKMDLVKQLHLNERKLVRYLMRIEQGYPDNPYHCRAHAAEVLRTLHVLLTRGAVLDTVSASAKLALAGGQSTCDALGLDQQSENVLASFPFKLLTSYLAAIIHDYEHKGVNNEFLIRTRDPLALRYNDISPMENHHAAAALSLLYDDHYALIPNANKRMQDTLRKEVIELVLSTDMKQHFAMVGVFSAKLAQDRPDQANRNSPLTNRSPNPDPGSNPRPKIARTTSGKGRLVRTKSAVLLSEAQPPVIPAWDAETRLLVLKMALKCADLGNLSSSINVHKEWVRRLEEEMFLQGDQERALGQPVSPLMDRNKAGVTKAQCSFYSVVALPMFQMFAKAFPASEGLVECVLSNYNYWRETEEASSSNQ